MTEMEDLKELFRAEIGIVRAEVKALSEDIKDIKASLGSLRDYCNGRHGEMLSRVGQLEKEQSAANRERKIVFAGLTVALTGAVKAFFDWITK